MFYLLTHKESGFDWSILLLVAMEIKKSYTTLVCSKLSFATSVDICILSPPSGQTWSQLSSTDTGHLMELLALAPLLLPVQIF